jgi:hypothetical protein
MREKIVGSRLRRFIEGKTKKHARFFSSLQNGYINMSYHDVVDRDYVARHIDQMADPVHIKLMALLCERFCPAWTSEPFFWAIFLHEDKCMLCVRAPKRQDAFFLNDGEARAIVPWARNNQRLIDRRVGELWNLGDADITAKFKLALRKDENAINGFGVDQHLFARNSLLKELRKVVSTAPQKTTKPATVHSFNDKNSTKG